MLPGSAVCWLGLFIAWLDREIPKLTYRRTLTPPILRQGFNVLVVSKRRWRNANEKDPDRKENRIWSERFKCVLIGTCAQNIYSDMASAKLNFVALCSGFKMIHPKSNWIHLSFTVRRDYLLSTLMNPYCLLNLYQIIFPITQPCSHFYLLFYFLNLFIYLNYLQHEKK